jgi:hypothetical protein
LRHFQAVLVGAGLKAHLLPAGAAEPGDDVSGNRFIGMADMRLAIGIVNCGGDIEGIGHGGARHFLWQEG